MRHGATAGVSLSNTQRSESKQEAVMVEVERPLSKKRPNLQGALTKHCAVIDALTAFIAEAEKTAQKLEKEVKNERPNIRIKHSGTKAS